MNHQNHEDQSDNKINFKYSQEGTLEFNSRSILADALVIGAVTSTCKVSFPDPNSIKYEYGTDRDGIKKVISKSDELLNHLHSSLSALGVVIAYSKDCELDEHKDSLGWLINNLSELANQIAFNNAEMNYSLTMKKPD